VFPGGIPHRPGGSLWIKRLSFINFTQILG
jgi:hypothetical protein